MRPGRERTRIVNGIGAWVLCAAGLMANAVAASELRGYVRDASTGQPIANAVVTAQGQISVTERQGAFVIEADTEQIQARAPGYRAMQQRWTGEDMVFDLSPFRPRAVYLSTFGVADASLRTAAERLVEQGAINALVIDAKGDRGQFSYPSPAGTDANAHTAVAVPTTGKLQSLVARSKWLGPVVQPVMMTVGTVPTLVIAPFFLIWFGVGRGSSILLVLVYCAVILYVFAQRAADNLDPVFEDYARTLGASPRRVIRDVLIPGTVPQILGGIRIALAGAWGIEAIVELLGAQQGIGKIVSVLAQSIDIEGIFAALVMLAIVAIACDVLTAWVIERLAPWSPAAARHKE